MERRQFLATPCAAALAPALAAGATPSKAPSPPPTGLLELRRYSLRSGPMAARFGAHVQEALVPALRRAGIGPVGVWNVLLGADNPTLHVLLPHADMESVASLEARLQADAEYVRAATAYAALPAADPPFLRCAASLHVTVPGCPAVVPPAGAAAGAQRIFELRNYRSPSEVAGRRKIEMFERAGELAIFRRVGLTTVFFARDLAADTLPSLTYMLVFEDAAAREKAWATFRADPEWLELRARPGFTDAEIVCSTSAVLLRPAGGSQI